jgi:hypothetical protein
MASVTLAESAKLEQDMLLAGVIETIITIDQFFEVLPFIGIGGNAIAYNRENAAGDVQFGTVGTTITAKAAATFTPVTDSLTKILGDAEVDEFIQATRSRTNDQKAIQIMSKVKSVGRQFSNTLINGDGTSESFNGLLDLLAAGQTITAGANGAALSFALLDELLDKVVDKDGIVDFITMNGRTLRSYYALLRGLGGATIGDTVTLPSGAIVPAYRGTPIFKNNWVPIDQVQGSESAATTVLAGTLDDGSEKIGISGITAENAAGISVQDIGISETKDESITRIKWYCGLSNFSQLGLAGVIGINN